MRKFKKVVERLFDITCIPVFTIIGIGSGLLGDVGLAVNCVVILCLFADNHTKGRLLKLYVDRAELHEKQCNAFEDIIDSYDLELLKKKRQLKTATDALETQDHDSEMEFLNAMMLSED